MRDHRVATDTIIGIIGAADHPIDDLGHVIDDVAADDAVAPFVEPAQTHACFPPAGLGASRRSSLPRKSRSFPASGGRRPGPASSWLRTNRYAILRAAYNLA